MSSFLCRRRSRRRERLYIVFSGSGDRMLPLFWVPLHQLVVFKIAVMFSVKAVRMEFQCPAVGVEVHGQRGDP